MIENIRSLWFLVQLMKAGYMSTKLKSIHPIAINIIIGTLFARLATSMSMPFLAIYLTAVKGVSPSFLIGYPTMFSTVFGSPPIAYTSLKAFAAAIYPNI